MPKKVKKRTRSRRRATRPVRLSIRNFAHIAEVDLTFGDLTVLVGPQGSGKSLALQWLKVALDGKHVVSALADAGHTTDRADVLIDLVFGVGMSPAWSSASEVMLDDQRVEPKNLTRLGQRSGERVFFVPAHRSALVADGWAAPFQRLKSNYPVVARIFSQSLYDRFSVRDAGALFPARGRLKEVVRRQIDDAIYHGGIVQIDEDHRDHARELRLVHGDMHLPFMTWTAGQREFTPLLLGLDHLLPSSATRKHELVDWVVIEEPEMGLHPRAITAALLLVLDLLWRGYRVVLSTHSPHVLTMVWMLRALREHRGAPQLVCEAFDVPGSGPMRAVAEAALAADVRVHALDFAATERVHSTDISRLDPDSDSDLEAEWGGLTAYSSRFGAAVRTAVNAPRT